MPADVNPPSDPDTPILVPAEVEVIDLREPKRERPRPPQYDAPPQIRQRRSLALFLFLATCVSTVLSGSALAGEEATFNERLRAGLMYSGALLSILLAHEMGHYLQARRYGVPASLPLFIPFPLSPFGTMGALIIQAGGVANRRAMFDIAISGPIAGLVLALPAVWYGLEHVQIVPAKERMDPEVIHFGAPLILQWMGAHIVGSVPDGYVLDMNPILFAGWVGVFITALNLIPIGQLDGGHILYTLIGKRAHKVAMLLIFLAVGYMIYTGNPSYSVMLILLMLMGPRHPPTADDSVPLGWFRILLGWLTLGFIVIGFTPTPIV
jgi:membrane-associated protease RseP (regulator of RpoE activity)